MYRGGGSVYGSVYGGGSGGDEGGSGCYDDGGSGESGGCRDGVEVVETKVLVDLF